MNKSAEWISLEERSPEKWESPIKVLYQDGKEDTCAWNGKDFFTYDTEPKPITHFRLIPELKSRYDKQFHEFKLASQQTEALEYQPLFDLIKIQDEYIAWLNKETSAVESIAYIHGFRHKEDVVRKGQEFRDKIALLKSQLPQHKESTSEFAEIKNSFIKEHLSEDNHSWEICVLESSDKIEDVENMIYCLKDSIQKAKERGESFMKSHWNESLEVFEQLYKTFKSQP